MFTLPQSQDHAATDEVKDGLPVIVIAEDGETVEHLLQFCHPSCAPLLKDLRLIRIVLGAAIKYDMQGVVQRVRRMLTASPFIEKEPLRVFAIAAHFNLDDDAALAARHTLHYPFFPRNYVPELELIPAAALHYLQLYHFMCGKAAKAIATSTAWISLQSCIYFGGECRGCGDEAITISNSATIYVRYWWRVYMRNAGEALVERPCGATVMRSDVMGQALKNASECSSCREKAFAELKEFSELFAAEVESAVSRVSEILIPPFLTQRTLHRFLCGYASCLLSLLCPFRILVLQGSLKDRHHSEIPTLPDGDVRGHPSTAQTQM